jgi:hypothetical protein
MAVSRHCRTNDGRVDASLRNAARAILDLAQTHSPPEYNDRKKRPEQKSVVKREPIYHRSDTSMRRYRVVVRRAAVVPVAPPLILPLERNNATLVPNDDGADPDEENTYHRRLGELIDRQKDVNVNRCYSGKNVPPIHVRNYQRHDSHVTGDIGNISSCPIVGRPLSLPPRLPIVGCKNRLDFPTSFRKIAAGVQLGKCLSQPPSLISLPKTIEFPRSIKD